MALCADDICKLEPEPESPTTELLCTSRDVAHDQRRAIPRAEVACRFYPRGRCRKGDQCPFRHDPAVRQSKPVVQDDPPLVLHGPAELAAVLGSALLTQWRGQGMHKACTHGFHARKAVMNPLAVSQLLQLLPGQGAVVDPFVGSGTTMIEVMRAGRAAFGYDISPLAVGIAQLHCWRPSSSQLHDFRAAMDSIVATLSVQEAGNGEGSAIIDWDRANRVVCEEAEKSCSEVAGALWFVMSHEQTYIWPEWRRPRGLAWRLDRTAGRFVAKVKELISAVPRKTPNAQMHVSDARSSCVPIPVGVDGVLTSPPYPAVYNYVEDDAHVELGLVSWVLMQQQRRSTDEIREPERPTAVANCAEIGSQKQFNTLASSPGSFEERWQADTEDWLHAAAEQLRPNGRIVMLIGDNAGVNTLASITAAAESISERSKYELRLLASASIAEDTRRPWAAKKRNYRSEHTILLEKMSTRD